MTTRAPCLASCSTIALPMPLLPPVTMATFPLRLMMLLPCDEVTNRSAAFTPHQNEGQGRHGQRNRARPADDAVQTQARLLLQRSHSEGRDVIAHLVKRNETACHRGGN